MSQKIPHTKTNKFQTTSFNGPYIYIYICSYEARPFFIRCVPTSSVLSAPLRKRRLSTYKRGNVDSGVRRQECTINVCILDGRLPCVCYPCTCIRPPINRIIVRVVVSTLFEFQGTKATKTFKPYIVPSFLHCYLVVTFTFVRDVPCRFFFRLKNMRAETLQFKNMRAETLQFFEQWI